MEKEERNIRKISKPTIIDKYKNICEKISNVENQKRGRIISYSLERKYVIIESVNSPGQTYLTFLNSFKEYIQLSDSILGKEVDFITVDENGKRMAKNVSFVSNE